MKPQSTNRPLIHRLIRPLLIGLCVGVVATTLLLLATAFLFSSVEIPLSAAMPLSVAAAGIGAFLAGLAAALAAGERGLLVGALCGALLYLIILLAGLARSNGIDTGYTFIKLAVLVVAGALGGVLGVNRRR